MKRLLKHAPPLFHPLICMLVEVFQFPLVCIAVVRRQPDTLKGLTVSVEWVVMVFASGRHLGDYNIATL